MFGNSPFMNKEESLDIINFLNLRIIGNANQIISNNYLGTVPQRLYYLVTVYSDGGKVKSASVLFIFKWLACSLISDDEFEIYLLI